MIKIPTGLKDQVGYMIKNNKQEAWHLLETIDEHLETSFDDFTRGYYARLREELGNSLGDNEIIEEIIYWLESNE